MQHQHGNPPGHPNADRWPRRICAAAGAYAIAAGAVTLTGWAANVPRLTDWDGDGISMFANTALASVLSGAAMVLIATGRYRLAASLGMLAGLIGAMTLFEHVTSLNIGIDSLLFPRDFGNRASAAPWRMGPPASACFIIIGTTLALSALRPALLRFAWVAGVIVVAVAMLSLVGYLYKVDRLYALPHLTGIAKQTSTVLLALGLGLIFAAPDSELKRLLAGDSAATGLFRRALPLIIVMPIVAGWLSVRGERAGIYDSAFGNSLRTLIEVALLTALLWWAAAAVRRHEDRAQQATEALRGSERRKTAMLESALDCIITIDHESQIVEFNASAERTFGRAREDVIGRGLAECILPVQYREAHTKGMARYLTTGHGPILDHRLELTALRADGTEFPIELTVSRVAGSEPAQFTAFLRDITERKQIEAGLLRQEEQLQRLVETRTAELERAQAGLRRGERLAAMGTLAAGLGHDLGNLLLPLRMRIDHLESQELDSSAREDVAGVKDGLTYIQHLASSLRLMAASPDSPPPAGGTDLARWSEDAVGALRAVLPRGVQLEMDCPKGLPPVNLHSAGLTQAVFNLVQNAGEAIRSQPTGAAPGVVRISARPSAAQEGWAALSVSDNGPGLTTEVAGRCFEPYFSTKDRAVSTGLGLSLVRGVMEIAGGTVECTSFPGEGATFILQLPPARTEALRPATAIVEVQSLRVRAVTSAILRALKVEIAPVVSRESDSRFGCVSLWVTDTAGEEDIEAFIHGGNAGRAVVILRNRAGAPVSDRLVVYAGTAPTTLELRSALEQALSRARSASATS